MKDLSKENSFNKEKQEKAIEWLKKKWPEPKQICEICGTKSWSIAEDLVMPMQFTEGALKIGGRTYPQMMVICINCGNTKYFNAVMVGLVEPQVKNEGENNAK